MARCQSGSLLWPLTSVFCTIAAHVPIVPSRVKYQEKRVISSLRISSQYGFLPAGLGFVAVVVGQPGGAGAALRAVGRPIQTVGRPVRTVGRPIQTCSAGKERAIVIRRPKGRPKLRNLYSYDSSYPVDNETRRKRISATVL
jgi:hypothetical protein